MKDEMIADEHGQSTIQSLYFDTPDYLLIRRSLDKPFYTVTRIMPPKAS